MTFHHPAMRAAFAPRLIAPLPIDLASEVRALTAMVKALKLQQLQDALFIDSVKADAYRYRHLREDFAMDAERDTDAFAELALLTGEAFDAAVDESMKMAEVVL